MEPPKIFNYQEEKHSLDITLDRNTLTFYLCYRDVDDEEKFLKQVFTYKELPIKMHSMAGTKEKAIQLFSKRTNFIVEPEKATIIVIARQIFKNDIIEKKIPIELKKSGPTMKP